MLRRLCPLSIDPPGVIAVQVASLYEALQQQMGLPAELPAPWNRRHQP